MARKKIRVPKRKYRNLKLNKKGVRAQKKKLTAIGNFDFVRGVKRAAVAAAALLIIYVTINFSKDIRAYYNSLENYGVKNINIKGAFLLDEDSVKTNVQGALRALHGTASPVIFSVDISTLKGVLEKLYGEINSIEIYKNYPSSITVEVNERTPLAALQINNSLNNLMDDNFSIFQTDRVKEYNFPIITGIKESEIQDGELTNIQKKEALKEIFLLTPPAVLRALDEINISDPSAVKVSAYNKEIRVGFENLSEAIKEGVDTALRYKDKKLNYIVITGDKKYINW